MVFQRAQALGYEWVMRMDDDSLLLSDIGYNLFDFMASRNLQYGYRLVSCELQSCHKCRAPSPERCRESTALSNAGRSSTAATTACCSATC